MKSHASPRPDRDLVRTSHLAYDAAYLPIAPEKSFGISRAHDASASRETKFIAWGTEVDGDKGLVAAPLHKRRAIFALSIWSLCFLKFRKKLLIRLLALLNHPLQHRRELAILRRIVVAMAYTMLGLRSGFFILH